MKELDINSARPRAVDAEDVAVFHRDGYVLVPGMFPAELMDAIEVWTQQLVEWPEVPGRHMAYYEDHLQQAGQRVLSRIENFCPFHVGFGALLQGTEVLDCMCALFGEAAVLFKDKVNFKMPGGDGFKAHQDVQAGWDRYASLHITLLVSIDDATVDNGCLELAPGVHRDGLLGASWAPLTDDLPVAYESIPTRRGDAVFFDSFTPHRSGPNKTDRPRRVLYVTYNKASEGDSRERYYADKRASYPPDCERTEGRRYAFKV